MAQNYDSLRSFTSSTQALRRHWLPTILLTTGLLAWQMAAAASAGEDLAQPGSGGAPAAGKVDLTFASLGVKQGEHLPRFIVGTLGDKPKSLDSAWWGKPALLLTSSLTCPKSRSRWPEAAKIAKKYGDSLNVVVVYVIEAHPVKDASPYKGVEDVTEENVRDDVLRRQPTTLEERLKLAAEFKDKLHVSVPIYVDGMDNAVWKALGGGPNMAVLVSGGGVVKVRQGWFEPDDMRKSINRLLAVDKKGTRVPVRGKPKKDPDEFESAKIRMADIARLVQMGKTDEFAKLLETMPELASSPIPYRYVGQGTTAGMCMLPHAAAQGQLDIVDLLIEHGADVDIQDAQVPTALYTAAKQGKLDVARKLLAHHADANRVSTLGISPLDEAVIGQHFDVARLLVEHGASQDVFTQAGLGHLDATRQAIERDPARAFLPDGDGRTPLVYAAAANQLVVARFLLAHGGLVHLQPRSRGEYSYRRAESPADWAALHGHAEMTNLLLDAGDPLTAGQMHDAVHRGHLAVVKVLIRHGANLESRDHWSNTPLHLAAIHGRADIATALIAAGANLEAQVGDYPGGPCGPGRYRATNETPLHLAAKYAQPELVQLLLSAKANAAARSTKGRTPLITAVGERKPFKPERLEIVKLLLDHGASIDARDKTGQNALARADEANDAELAALLRELGASEDAEDPAAEAETDSDSPPRGVDIE